ncbi:MAG: hypothetical protein ACLPSW_32445 [Roseiarcus sp.]
MGSLNKHTIGACCIGYLGCIFFTTPLASEPLYFTSHEKRPESDSYVFILPYCTEVDNLVNFSINGAGQKSTSTDPAKGATTTAQTAVTNIGLTVQGQGHSPAFLYLNKSALFSDFAEVHAGDDCLLTSSDSHSDQQVQSILTELAQTAAAVASPSNLVLLTIQNQTWVRPKTANEICNKVITETATNGGYFMSFKLKSVAGHMPSRKTVFYRHNAVFDDAAPDDKKLVSNVSIDLILDQKSLTDISHASWDEGSEQHEGFVAYYPRPVSASLICRVQIVQNGGSADAANSKFDKTFKGNYSVMIASPTQLKIYADSDWVDPLRDFFTNPQDTYTLSSGFLTQHKYSASSPAKTVVDTVTSPIRSLMPSVNVKTTVVSGGGKPDQTTKETDVNPPK